MTIWIVMAFCTVASPTTCRHIVSDKPVELMIECLLEGEQQGAGWLEAHPGWELDGVTCTVGDKPTIDDQTPI